MTEETPEDVVTITPSATACSSSCNEREEPMAKTVRRTRDAVPVKPRKRTPAVSVKELAQRLTGTQEQVLQIANLVNELARRVTVVASLPLVQGALMTVASARACGYDCGRYGANEANCHFSIFAAQEYTNAWENGKAEGEAERLAQQP